MALFLFPRVTRVRDIASTIRDAFYIAQSNTPELHDDRNAAPGPVFIELPLDLLYSPLEFQSELGLLERVPRKQLKPDISTYGALVIPHEAPKGSKEDPLGYLETLGECLRNNDKD